MAARKRNSSKPYQNLPSQRTRRSRKRILFIVLLILAAFGGYRILINKEKEKPITISEVKRENLQKSLSVSGEVAAEESLDLTFQTSGKVAWVGVKEGQSVSANQLIATLDKRELEFQLRRLLNTWEVEFTKFDDTNEGVKDTVLTDAVKRIKLRSQRGLDNTQLDVEIQNVAIELAAIYAPFSGIIAKASPSLAGVNVTPATAAYTLINPDSTFFEAEVNEIDVTNLKIGQEAKVELDAYPTTVFFGKVKGIAFSSVISSTGGTVYKVKINLPENEDLRFKIGMKGSAQINLETIEAALVIPSQALVEEDSDKYVWSLDGKNKLKKVSVEVGTISFDKIQILTGLNENQKIIVSPHPDFKEGETINSRFR